MGTHATRSFRRTVPVLKLHGSSNWAYVGEHGTRAWIYEGYSEFAANYAPILIPPTWKKGEVTGLTAEVWKAAYAAIRDATRICIIGFSMPETDPHFKHLVAAALSENRGLYSLDVVDFGANAALRQRYEDFFAPMKAYRRFRFSEVGLQGFFEQLAFKQLGCGEVITSFNRMY
jgi:hypothetical protein